MRVYVWQRFSFEIFTWRESKKWKRCLWLLRLASSKTNKTELYFILLPAGRRLHQTLAADECFSRRHTKYTMEMNKENYPERLYPCSELLECFVLHRRLHAEERTLFWWVLLENVPFSFFLSLSSHILRSLLWKASKISFLRTIRRISWWEIKHFCSSLPRHFGAIFGALWRQKKEPSSLFLAKKATSNKNTFSSPGLTLTLNVEFVSWTKNPKLGIFCT